MKLKKILTVLGCFVLVLMCAFTVVGCGEIEATKDEIAAFLQADDTEISFEDKGFHFDLYSQFWDAEVIQNGYVKMNGEIVPTDESVEAKIYVEYYYEEATSGMTCAFSGTYYLKDGKVYSTKTKQITNSPSDTMTGSLLASVDQLAQNVVTSFETVFGYEGEQGTTLTYQKKGDVSKKNVEFTATAKNSILKNTVFVKYNNGKLVEFLSDIKGEGASVKVSIKEYNGKINFPSFDNYEDKTTPVAPPATIVAPSFSLPD